MKNLLTATLCWSLNFLLIHAAEPERRLFRILSYNVENYFDCVDDSLTRDEEYLPGGIRGWNYSRYVEKQWHIAQVIVAVGAWEPPALIGLCEVESRKAMEDLTRYSVLKNMGYDFVHHESPDTRGVDVALLYQPGLFRVIRDAAVRVDFPEAPGSTTRDILYVSGVVGEADTLHVFVCHFPSRLGGEAESEGKRIRAAQVLRARVDSLFGMNLSSKIVIMGDFNDYPDNRSMSDVLRAAFPGDVVPAGGLCNLMYPLHLAGKGSHKHDGIWGALDQIIVSAALLDTVRGLHVERERVRIFDAPFLLEDDLKFLGKQPFRTYVGMRYHGGFSDHLPVYVDCRF